MVTKPGYYVYAHLDQENKIRYIGAGSGYRCNAWQNRHQDWHDVFPDHRPKVVFLAEGLSQEQAFEIETHEIAEARRRGDLLINQSDGGLGNKGFKRRTKRVRTQAEKEAISAGLKAYAARSDVYRVVTDQTRENMRKAHLGKPQGPRTGAALLKLQQQAIEKMKPVLCIETGKVYPSAKHAAEELGIQRTKIGAVCRGIRKKHGNLTWQYIED